MYLIHTLDPIHVNHYVMARKRVMHKVTNHFSIYRKTLGVNNALHLSDIHRVRDSAANRFGVISTP